MQLAVPVRQVSVTVLSTDGIWSEGHLFLRPLAENHTGPETVLDRLNDRDEFLPVQLPGERDDPYRRIVADQHAFTSDTGDVQAIAAARLDSS